MRFQGFIFVHTHPPVPHYDLSVVIVTNGDEVFLSRRKCLEGTRDAFIYILYTQSCIRLKKWGGGGGGESGTENRSRRKRVSGGEKGEEDMSWKEKSIQRREREIVSTCIVNLPRVY